MTSELQDQIASFVSDSKIVDVNFYFLFYVFAVLGYRYIYVQKIEDIFVSTSP